MRRNYREEYRDAYRQAMDNAKHYGTSSDIMIYLSFTKYGREVFKKLNNKEYEDAVLDYELGVIDKDEYKILIDAYSIIENSIAEACVY